MTLNKTNQGSVNSPHGRFMIQGRFAAALMVVTGFLGGTIAWSVGHSGLGLLYHPCRGEALGFVEGMVRLAYEMHERSKTPPLPDAVAQMRALLGPAGVGKDGKSDCTHSGGGWPLAHVVSDCWENLDGKLETFKVLSDLVWVGENLGPEDLGDWIWVDVKTTSESASGAGTPLGSKLRGLRDDGNKKLQQLKNRRKN